MYFQLPLKLTRFLVLLFYMNPNYLESSSKSFEGHLNYLISSSHPGQTVNLDWCVQPKEEHHIESRKKKFIDFVIGQLTCLYVSYIYQAYIGEKFLMERKKHGLKNLFVENLN